MQPLYIRACVCVCVCVLLDDSTQPREGSTLKRKQDTPGVWFRLDKAYSAYLSSSSPSHAYDSPPPPPPPPMRVFRNRH